jgi:hypothetical protein
VVPKGGRARPETPGKQTRKLWSPFPASLPPPPMSGLISLPSCARHAWALGAGKGGREAAKLGNLFTEGPGCFSELTGRAESALQPRVLVLITRSTLALHLFLCSRSTLSGCGRQQAGPEAWEKKGWLCLHPCRETKMGVSVCVCGRQATAVVSSSVGHTLVLTFYLALLGAGCRETQLLLVFWFLSESQNG